MKLEEARTESLKSQDYQAGWNAAHEDVTIKNIWLSPSEIAAGPDYVEGYLASQDNLLEARSKARLNASSAGTAE